MCGRYTAIWSGAQFAETFGVQGSLFENYNVAPTQFAPVVIQPGFNREILDAKWGLLPRWVDKPADFRASMFNARAETLTEKASFKRPFKTQRCLVPASGFYEWVEEGGVKQPYYIHPKDGELLAFAGLWERWQGEDDVIYSYTVITTEANETMQGLHSRMPVILPVETFSDWLRDNSDPDDLLELLHPYEGDLETYPVHRRVGRTRENDAGLIDRLELAVPF